MLPFKLSAAHLLRPLCNPRLVIPRIFQLGKEERIEIVGIESFGFALFGLFRSRHDERSVKVDNLVVEPLGRLKSREVLALDLFTSKFADNPAFFES